MRSVCFQPKFMRKHINPFFIGFCGKIYPVLNIVNEMQSPAINVYCYDYDEAIAISKAHDMLSQYKYHHNSVHSFGGFYNNNFNLDSLFLQYNVPIFVVELDLFTHEAYLSLNRRLSDFGFYRIIHPVQAYQEIEMFFNSVLVDTTLNMVNISDKDMIVKKGFDKFSFRKESTTPK
jgi:hypothetical protein